MGEKCGGFTADFLVFKCNVCSASGREQLYWEMEDQISWVQSSLGAAQTKPSPGSQPRAAMGFHESVSWREIFSSCHPPPALQICSSLP